MKPNVVAVQLAAAFTIWLVVALAIGTEVYPPFKAFLTSLLGQHWTAKSVISVVAFALFYILLKRSVRSSAVLSSTLFLVLSAIAGGIVIFGFYVWHFLYA